MSDSTTGDQPDRDIHSGDDWHRPGLGFALAGGTLVVLVLGVLNLPRAAAALPNIARQAMEIALPRWGQNEVVSEVVYGSRGWDTFGETFLLLAAVVSVVTLTRSPEPRTEYVGEETAGRAEQREVDPTGSGDDSEEEEARQGEKEEQDEDEDDLAPNTDGGPLGARAPDRAAGMTVVVRVATRIVAPVLAVAGFYLCLLGYTPGGGFPAGAVIMGVALLLYTAYGHAAVSRAVRPSVIEPIELAGAVAIIAVGLFGLLFKSSMFANYLPLAKPGTIIAGGTNQLFSGAELIEVATGLTIATFSLLGMKHDWAPDPDEDEGDGADEANQDPDDPGGRS